jgi:hypothetical protein
MNTTNPVNPADGKFVVVQGGQRVTGPMENQQQAQAEADRRNKLNEGTGQVKETAPAQVKQNLFG